MKNEANKAIEPIPVNVTDHASACSEPAIVMAHLDVSKNNTNFMNLKIVSWIFQFVALASILHAEASYTDAPAQVTEAASEWLRQNLGTAKVLVPSITGDVRTGQSWRRCHFEQLAGILHEAFPNNSAVGAWQVGLVDGSEIPGRIIVSKISDETRFGGFTVDPLARRLIEAVRFANTPGSDIAGNYEIREYSSSSVGFQCPLASFRIEGFNDSAGSPGFGPC